ncbi:enterobactin synthetase component F [Poseidonocella pacifica]|uniref:Enterobactin synthetase component F n=1 Tax=Poseidonocella pacifica TaxID=871651 RepID=A0A1I0WRQ2_9RHOB|nr:non-ribosomal peptide synthetase [Poseidonocella pacifica]SFA90666.1 enterobactin synthetase component F [Poseidonocella pacifica]
MSDPIPLCAAQEGIWYAQVQSPESPIFNTGQALHLHGCLDVEAMLRAMRKLAQEAECLRLRFMQGESGPVMWLEPDGAPEPSFRDLSEEDAPRTAFEAAVLVEARTPVDLRRGPISALTLWWLGTDHFVVSQRVHHLAADGYANLQLTRRLAALYEAETSDRPAPAPFGPFDRIAEWDRAQREDPARRVERVYWHDHLADLAEVGSFKPGAAQSAAWFDRQEVELSAEMRAGLVDLADRTRIAWPDLVTSLTAAYCARSVTEGESVPGIPLMNRLGSPAARIPSTQVNVLPFRHRFDEDAPLTDAVADAAKTLAEMRRNGRYRGEMLRRELGRVGQGRRLHGPLINVLPFDPSPRIEGLRTSLQILGAGSVDDMTFAFRGDLRSGLILQLDSNPNHYRRDEAAAHLHRLCEFLRASVTAARLADVPTISKAEFDRHVHRRNATAHPVPETTLSALIEAQMKRSPDAVALRFKGEALSYAELNRRSAALAGHLAARGIGPEDRVAVALPRSMELLVALVGVLRAGAAYVPLDPEDTSSRRTDMLTRAEPRAVLAAPDFPAPPDLLIPPQVWAEVGGAPVRAKPRDPAYVLFTSGSTGRPKGVVVEHDAIVNRLLWMQSHYGITRADRILQKTPATFDVSVWEFFLPLIAGATLVIAPPGAHRDPRALAGILRDEGITAMHFVPSMLTLFLDAPESEGLAIPQVFVSGEALPSSLATAFHSRIKGRLHNLYGPTEAAVDVSYREAGEAEEGLSVPIGRPVWNTRLYCLDARKRPVPDGVTGRLYLAGRQLARGYLGQPELTEERFLPDPFHPGERMYDTGDLAVATPEGEFVFVGRADGQVKIRGVRVETGEVEAALTETGLVRQCAVMAQDAPSGGSRLIAWVVPREGDVTSDMLRSALAQHLPSAMVPGVFVLLDALPLNPSGKLDRKALPAPRVETFVRSAAEGTESLLVRLYAEVLGLDGGIGPETDFFAAGGDSLSAVRLSLRVEEETGRDPGLGLILEAPVVADLARRFDAAAAPYEGLSPVLHLSKGGRAPLFAVHPAGGIGWCYRGLAGALSDRPLIALQSPLLTPECPAPGALGDLAESYCDRVEEVVPSGMVHVAGWSLGGLIAQDIAVRLARRGRSVGLVGLLDSYPSSCWRDEPEPSADDALRALLAIAGHDPEAYPELRGRDRIVGFLRAKGHALAALPEPVLDGVIRSVQETNRLVRGHREARYDGPVLHVRAARDHVGTALRPELWEPFARRVVCASLPCLHGELLAERHRFDLVQALEAVMADAEGGANSPRANLVMSD